MINEHPFAFSLGTNPTLIQPTLPALVQAAKVEGLRAESSVIFPLYRTLPRRHASVLLHIYAVRTTSGRWNWRSLRDIRQRVMLYYYIPTEALVRQAIRPHARRCVITPICDLSDAAGIEIQVKAPDTIAEAVGTDLAQMFPNNTIEYTKIDSTVRYRIAVRNVYEN